MFKLENLSPRQIEMLDDVREEWLLFCLGGNTEINREIAANGIRWIYSLAKLQNPFIIFVGGPMEAQYVNQSIKAVYVNQSIKAVEKYNKLTAQVADRVWAQVAAQAADQVANQVAYQVAAQVAAQVRAQVANQVANQKFTNYSWNDLTGDVNWVSFYDFFDRIGIKVTDNIKKYRDYLRSGVFMTIFVNGFAIAIPRPKIVYRDESNRLHGEDFPAIEWDNGEKYYMWHGIPVSEKLILRPDEISREEIIAEKNSEVSRATAEKLGWDEYLKRAEAILIDKWFDPEKISHYELFEIKDNLNFTPRFLKMESAELKDGTRPYYIKPVDPGLKTCKAARMWQFQKSNGAWPSVDECNKGKKLSFEDES